MKRIQLLIALMLMLTPAASPAWAQCSLCQVPVDQNQALGLAFNKGIFLMVVPAMAIFAGIFFFAIRRTSKPSYRSHPDSLRESSIPASLNIPASRSAMKDIMKSTGANN
jgi:hypothetical protein